MNILELSAILSLMGAPAAQAPAPLLQPVAQPVTCRVTKAPIINIRPITKEIAFDFSKTSAELNQITSNTISPYGASVDQTTGGLRHDKPVTQVITTFHALTERRTQSMCLSYDTITLTILLRPKIYIAKEFNRGRCGREVMKHEKKHVHVDRYVINKYSKQMGKAVQKAVNQAGVIGPFSANRAKEFQEMMFQNIQSAISSIELAMMNEMNSRQQQVDSLEEYERVGQYCEKAGERARKNRSR